MPTTFLHLFRRTAWTLLISFLALAFGQLSLDPAHAQRLPTVSEAQTRSPASRTTVAYVVTFYPLWFTFNQGRFGTPNRLAGPDRVSPLYQSVVAVNDDTLYASTFLDLTAQPVILTIPATTATYSVLTLDPYGDIFESGIQPQTPGTYALTGPEFNRDASRRGHLHRDASQLHDLDLPGRQVLLNWRGPNCTSRAVPQVTAHRNALRVSE
jgi:hypothetical protein